MKHVSGVAAASWLTLVGVTMSCGGDTPPRPVEQVRLGVRYGPHTVIGPFLCDTKRHGQDCAEMDVGKAGVGTWLSYLLSTAVQRPLGAGGET